MGRWDNDRRSDAELLADFRDLQLRLLHQKDRRKNALGKEAIEKVDSKIKELYQEMKELYERNHERFQFSEFMRKTKGFECFAWYLMLSEDTRKEVK
tara:strand:+ start:57 stop:347 length:291 start_codon:yes stop_codon:yes gene_type:complete